MVPAKVKYLSKNIGRENESPSRYFLDNLNIYFERNKCLFPNPLSLVTSLFIGCICASVCICVCIFLVAMHLTVGLISTWQRINPFIISFFFIIEQCFTLRFWLVPNYLKAACAFFHIQKAKTCTTTSSVCITICKELTWLRK